MSNPVKTVDSAESFEKLEINFAGHVKGEDPTDVRQKCLTLCQQFLAGNWIKLTIDDIEVERLTGGMSNKIYRCKVVDSLAKDNNEPQEVAVRFYGVKYDWTFNQSDDRLDEALIALLASEKGLGPHLYGLFEGGQIQKYYPHRHFTEKDLDDPDLLYQLASKLARFHGIKAPIPKNYDMWETILTSSVKRLKKSPENWRKVFEKYDCKALLESDMSSEVKWVLDMIPGFNSTQVFAHNDFRFPNVMISGDNQVVLGDIEFSSYYCRGIDFATIFANTDLDNNAIKEFIKEYIKEGEKIFGKTYSENPNNSVEHILKEVKQFSMVHSLLVANVIVHNDFWKIPISEKTSMTVANNSMDKYLAIKKLLIESKLI